MSFHPKSWRNQSVRLNFFLLNNTYFILTFLFTVLSSRVEVKEGVPVKIKKEKIISSKVEIKSEAPVILSSKVEVVTKEQPILSSKVEVITNQKPLSSVVHILTSDEDDEPAVEVEANNIDKPEYDFLNRQPSEIVDESYKVGKKID